MTKSNSLTTEQLSILELCIEPQSFQAIKGFLDLDDEKAEKIIKDIEKEKLLEEVHGPTYTFWQITKKGKDLLQL